MNFKKGDRIRVTHVDFMDKDEGISVGDEGILMDNDKTCPTVQFDKNKKLDWALDPE